MPNIVLIEMGIDKSSRLFGFTSCAAFGDSVRDDQTETVGGHTVCRHCHAELARAFAAIDDLTAETAPLFWQILFADYRPVMSSSSLIVLTTTLPCLTCSMLFFIASRLPLL